MTERIVHGSGRPLLRGVSLSIFVEATALAQREGEAAAVRPRMKYFERNLSYQTSRREAKRGVICLREMAGI